MNDGMRYGIVQYNTYGSKFFQTVPLMLLFDSIEARLIYIHNIKCKKKINKIFMVEYIILIEVDVKGIHLFKKCWILYINVIYS